MNEYTQQEQYMIDAASDLYEEGSSDKAIAMGLTQGDGWWGNVLATGHYVVRDLASDFHDFCDLNSLDRTDIQSAEYFLKQIKSEQMLNELKKDFE